MVQTAGSDPGPLAGVSPSLEHPCQHTGWVPTQPLLGPITRPHPLGVPALAQAPQMSTYGCSWAVAESQYHLPARGSTAHIGQGVLGLESFPGAHPGCKGAGTEGALGEA